MAPRRLDTDQRARRSILLLRDRNPGPVCQARPGIDRCAIIYNNIVMEQTGYTEAPADLDAVFAALADPTRRAILSRLAQGQASVNEIAAPFNISQPAVSRHLKVLQRAGLIERGVEEQRRPARLKAETMAAAVGWLAGFKAFWGGSFDRPDDVLMQIKHAGRKDGSDA